MVKRILLLGASKNIGFHVLEEIAPQRDLYELFVVARTPADNIAPFKGKENVTFIAGDAKEFNVLSDVVNNTMGGKIDYVVMTIGATVVFSKFGVPRMGDPTVCGDVAKTLVQVLKPLSNPPVVVAASSTGILSSKDLLPLLWKPLYRGLLHKPHQDKVDMENTISEEYLADKWVILRGALYKDGPKTGKYRAGEREVGYFIRRSDVADFIVKECINGEGKWLGKRPVIVY